MQKMTCPSGLGKNADTLTLHGLKLARSERNKGAAMAQLRLHPFKRALHGVLQQPIKQRPLKTYPGWIFPQPAGCWLVLWLAFNSLSFAQQLPPTLASAPARTEQTTALNAGSIRSAPVPASAPLTRIAPGDLLEVTVFDTPELSQKTRVDNDGDVELVVGGKVHTAGLTASEAGQAIETRLTDAKVLRNPHVSVNLVESATQTVTVLGEVRNPGSYSLWGQQQVVDAIALAGGVTQFASHTVTLTHKDSSTVSTVDLNSSAQSADTVLLPGDRVVVGRTGTVYVLGDVGKPGGFALDDRTPITVLQGLALAQGLNHTANFHGSLIRQTETGPQQQPLDLKKILANQMADSTLHDGDIVYFPVNGAKEWASRSLNSILQMAVGVVIYGRYN